MPRSCCNSIKRDHYVRKNLNNMFAVCQVGQLCEQLCVDVLAISLARRIKLNATNLAHSLPINWARNLTARCGAYMNMCVALSLSLSLWAGGCVGVRVGSCGWVGDGVVWCGVVWCGVVWCGVVWCGVVWCGVVWCGVVCVCVCVCLEFRGAFCSIGAKGAKSRRA